MHSFSLSRSWFSLRFCGFCATKFPHSWRLMQCLAPRCTPDFLTLWPSLLSLHSACQSGPEWPGAHESTRGQLLCISDLWALQQEGLWCKCTEQGWTWVHNKSKGCFTAPIFTRLIIGSILQRAETKCFSGIKRLRGLETQPDNKLEGSLDGNSGQPAYFNVLRCCTQAEKKLEESKRVSHLQLSADSWSMFYQSYYLFTSICTL